MSGCVRLDRLVTRTLVDAAPSARGRFSASTSSTTHMSVAKVRTDPPGSPWPTSPSVEANMSITGTPNAAVSVIRVSAVSCSLVDVTDRGAIASRPSICSRASCASFVGYPMSASGWSRLRRSTASAIGSVAGTETNRTGPDIVAIPNPLACTGDAAMTAPITRPSPDDPAAISRAIDGRMIDAARSANSASRWTKMPRRPELPPDARHTYSSNSSVGRLDDPAMWRSTLARVNRRSVTTSSNAAIMSVLLMVGSAARSVSSKRSGSPIGPRRRA